MCLLECVCQSYPWHTLCEICVCHGIHGIHGSAAYVVIFEIYKLPRLLPVVRIVWRLNPASLRLHCDLTLLTLSQRTLKASVSQPFIE